MKRHLLVIVILAVSCMTFLSSCKKDDEETKKDLITARWQGETVTTNLTLNGVVLPAETENISTSFIEFNSNGTYTSDDNGAFDGSGTWKLSNGDKDIILDAGTADEAAFTIDALTSSDLKLSFSEEETEDGITFKVTGVIDFKK